MPHFTFKLEIKQLGKRRGRYHYLEVGSIVVNQFDKKSSTRLICIIDNRETFSSRFANLDDENYYILLSAARLKKINKVLGDMVSLEIFEDPNPLGVSAPEVLEVFLHQDKEANVIYEKLTDSRKRNFIYSILKIKDIDLQLERIIEFFKNQD